MINGPEKKLIEALKNVDAHGDVAPPHVHDPMTMVLRENAIQTNLMRWDDVRDRYVLTGAGRRRISARGHAPSTILSLRKRDVLRGGVPQRKPAIIAVGGSRFNFGSPLGCAAKPLCDEPRRARP